MTTWTPDAEAFFRSYLASQFGARPVDEVAQDLRCHVHEELTQQGVSQVTEIELERVFKQIGSPDEAALAPQPERHASKPLAWTPEPSSTRRPFRLAAWYILCVFVPFIVTLLEFTNHWCAQTFFDPMPTLWHVPLILLVPAMACWLRAHQNPWTPRELRVAACASGAAVMVAIYYAVITMWWLPMALTGLLAIGLGLIPLAPQLSWIGIGQARKYQWKRLASAQEIPWQWWSRRGMGLGVLCLALLEGPSYVGRTGLSMAIFDNPATRDRGLALIRHSGYEQAVLKACYRPQGPFTGAEDAADMFFSFFGTRVSRSAAQPVYFALTGETFNTQAPPPLHSRLAPRTDRNAITFDPDQGGDRVGGRFRGLSMDASRMDTHVDPASRLTYTEWSLNFDNQGSVQREARCQVLLPPGSVVSRLTLWINGEPQEAAFAANSQVKAAYKEVVNVERRDPVLVTLSGPDRVLVQCFPVLPRGRMQIRLGITAPWSEETPELLLPKIVERNFSYADKLEHAIWLQGEGFGPCTQINVSNAELVAGNGLPDLSHLAEDLPGQVWSRDPFAAPEEAIVIGTRKAVSAVPTNQVILVLDDSIAMKPHVDAIKHILKNTPSERFGILLASEAVRGNVSSGNLEVLDRWHPKDGVSNMTALLKAARLLLESNKHGDIVWIHGPQPNAGFSMRLKQILERGTGLRLFDVPAALGANAVIDGLKNAPGLHAGPAFGPNFNTRFARFLMELTQPHQRLEWQWTHQAADAPLPDGAVKVSDQLARYATFLQGNEAWHQHHDSSWKHELARYQLVTPMTGAVVLERHDQYAKHGLKQVDGSTTPVMPTVPVVPEPSTALLVLFGTSATLLRRRRPCHPHP